METISKAVFGSGAASSEEPVAGAQGAGTPDSPYDKGNEEAEKNDAPSNAQPSETTGDPASAQTGHSGGDKNQGANAPSQEPSDDKDKLGMPHTDEEREKLMEKGEFPHDPNDHSGEPLKMHSAKAEGEGEDEGGEDTPKDRKDSVGQEGGDPHGEEKKGDGTQYVKTSGVAADGGDFDATKPGAGAEANRLLEEKGVHKDKDADSSQVEDDKSSGSGAPPAPKESKLQKIKDKLHIH